MLDRSGTEGASELLAVILVLVGRAGRHPDTERWNDLAGNGHTVTRHRVVAGENAQVAVAQLVRASGLCHEGPVTRYAPLDVPHRVLLVCIRGHPFRTEIVRRIRQGGQLLPGCS